MQYSTLKSTGVQYNSGHTGAGIKRTGEKSYWWRRERRWAMVKLKGCQQQEIEGKLRFHSHLMEHTLASLKVWNLKWTFIYVGLKCIPYATEKLKCFGQPNRLLGGTVVKILPANAGDSRGMGSIPGLERFSGVGNGNQLQYSCLKNCMDRGAW